MNSMNSECPVCSKEFPTNEIEKHVNRCIFLFTQPQKENHNNNKGSGSGTNKRNFNIFGKSPESNKKMKLGSSSSNKKSDLIEIKSDSEEEIKNLANRLTKTVPKTDTSSVPLSERMRPKTIEDYVGQTHIMQRKAVLRTVLESNDLPSMILWGPPGCGKTSLANIIAERCKNIQSTRYVKLSATMVGVNDVKEVIKIAKNEQKFKRKTILFMDEIHRFNKLQQDIFLPHIESGTITLIGATTENPSFSLNNALLSRCRVIVLEKLTSEDLFQILSNSLKLFKAVTFDKNNDVPAMGQETSPKILIHTDSLMWLAEMCDGDARIALDTLQLTMKTLEIRPYENGGVKMIRLEDFKDGIKKSHLLYDRRGDQHYDIISAVHKSIRASDDNAALYWTTRLILGGEDPKFICRRLMRAASEDIGLADPNALSVALAASQAVQLIGMPEADCIIAQCAVYLARAPKSREMDRALAKCKADIKECKGPMPSVPLHLRNAPTKMMKDLGFGAGYNMREKNKSGLEYMPEGMEDRNYFSE